MINVTKPSLPALEKYIEYLNIIWSTKHLTNSGPLVQQLEKKLAHYLKTQEVIFLTNGTIALQLAIRALNIKGEIITTPFSYIATTSSIIWENCHPIFADIKEDTLTIDPLDVEKKITKNTKAILATHVYGIPCEVEQLDRLATHYDLKIIYDAAHAFGVKYKDQPLINFGNISTLSFHATKLFHTVEGGAVAGDKEVMEKIARLRNFGQTSQGEYFEPGINAKNSELHAAIGLCHLEMMDDIIFSRRKIVELYDQNLLNNNSLRKPIIPEFTEYNYSYYPIIFPSEELLLKVIAELNQENIYPRRYFYPCLTKLNFTKGSCSLAEEISKRIVCLPLYYELPSEIVIKISSIISKIV